MTNYVICNMILKHCVYNNIGSVLVLIIMCTRELGNIIIMWVAAVYISAQLIQSHYYSNIRYGIYSYMCENDNALAEMFITAAEANTLQREKLKKKNIIIYEYAVFLVFTMPNNQMIILFVYRCVLCIHYCCGLLIEPFFA